MIPRILTTLVMLAGLAPPGMAATGQDLFASRCASCHRVAPPTGDKWLALYDMKGPDLSSAGTKFTPGYLQRWLGEPQPVHGAYPYFRYTRPTDQGDRLVTDGAMAHPVLYNSQRLPANAMRAEACRSQSQRTATN